MIYLKTFESSKDKIYYHGRSDKRPYRGNYIYLTDNKGYAILYSDQKVLYSFKLKKNVKLFSFKKESDRKLLKEVLDDNTWKFLLKKTFINGKFQEIGWADLGIICNEEYELPEDVIQSIGFNGIKLEERENIESIYIFNVNDIDLVDIIDITTPKYIKYIAQWHKQHDKNIF